MALQRFQKNRPHRTFWDWFEAQGARDDALGELSRRVVAEESRNYRRLTFLTLHEFIRDELGGDDQDYLLAVQADQEFRDFLDIPGRLQRALEEFRRLIHRPRLTLSVLRKEWLKCEIILDELIARQKAERT